LVERIGERACFKTPRNWRPNIALISSMSSEGMGLPLAVQGSTTREVFEAYIDKVLTPALKRGQIVLMDDLPSHKREPGRRLIEERSCELLYLPPYSPNLSR
jgi:transposase